MESGSGVAGLASSTEDPRSVPVRHRLFSWLWRRLESQTPAELLMVMVMMMVMMTLMMTVMTAPGEKNLEPYCGRGAVVRLPHSAVADHSCKQALYFLLFVLLHGWTIVFLLGQGPQQAGRIRDHLIYKPAIKAFGGFMRLLASLIHLVAVAAAAFAAAIAPAQPQLSTAQQELRSQQSTVEEELQPDQSTAEEDVQSQPLATEEELESAVQEDIATEELHLPTEEELRSQLSATEEDDLSQQLAAIVPQPQLSTIQQELRRQHLAVEELQSQRSTVVEDLQSQLSTFEEEQFQHSTTEEGFLLVNIWNIESLKQCSRNLIACFKNIHQIQFAAAHSPVGSSCSSPTQYDYNYRDALVHEKNNEQRLPFKSLLLLNQGAFYTIDYRQLAQLEDMIQLHIGKLGYQQILYGVFEHNSSMVDSFLFDCFNSVDLSVDPQTCMADYESTTRCVMSFKVMAGLLCLMKSELEEVECVAFDQDLRDYYFKLCARQSIQHLIEAAGSVSNLKCLASDIYQIYQMLVLYEAIIDVLRAFSCPNEYGIIVQQMQVNFKGIFDGIKTLRHANLNDSRDVTNDKHPLTYFLTDSMELLENHNCIVQLIFVADATSSLGDLLLEVIRDWADELEGHSERHCDSYAKGKKYIFLLNNLASFTWKIKKSLQVLVPSECGNIIEFLKSRISKYTAEYLDKCWAPVRKFVELSSGQKPCLSSLNEFITQFEAIIDCQGTWVLETNRKYRLREEIKNYITPCYRSFLQELQKRPHLRPVLLIRKYMTTEQLDNHVDNLFESGT